MKKVTSVVCTALLAMSLHTAPALAADVTVTLPTFPVTLNGVTMEQSTSQYPMLVYKDITYVPMTWADTRLLGLESNWTQQGGLVIEKSGTVQDQKTAQSAYQPYKADTANAKSYKAVTASGKITVNGKAITNSSEEYPLLVFRDVTYFPLTWRFAVTEFGWDYSFDSKNGLVITPKVVASGSSNAINTSGDIIGQKVKVTASSVNLRADAGTSSATVGQAQKGEELLVLGTTTVDGKLWYQVMRTSGGDKMWIASWYTEISAGNSGSTSTGNTSSGNTSSGNTSSSTNTSNSSSMVGKVITVTGTTVNLRANTSTTAAVIGQTVKGDTYTVLAEKTVDGDTWYQVQTKSGAKAWIAGWLTQAGTGTISAGTGNSNSNTTVTEDYSMVGKKIVVNASGVNLRKEPGTGSAVAAVATKGTEYTILTLKTVDGDVWYQVQHNGSKVWIASWLTTLATTSNSSGSGTNAGVSTGTRTHLELTSVQNSGSKTVITVKHGSGNSYSTVKATATSLVLQMNNVYLNPSDSMNESCVNGPLQHLLVQDAGTDALKMTLTLQKGAYCTVKENGDDLVITAYNQHAAGETGLSGKVIVIDPGHGGSDPGAIGKVLGVTDANVGLTVGQRLRDLLEAQGATVIMTRDTDVRVDLNDRPAMANAVEADLFVSIHANSTTSAEPKGIQVYYYAPSTSANLYAQSYIRKDLATQVSDSMQATTGTSSVVKTANYAVLRENDRPSILVETGFLSNAEEEALLATDEYRQKLANGIYQGICNYLNQY